jgi:hypothetical protein
MNYCYKATGLFSLEDIVRMRDRARDVYGGSGGFLDFSYRAKQSGELIIKGPLEPLPEAKGVEFGDFFIIGHLPVKEKSLDELFLILAMCEDPIGRYGNFSIEIGYEEKTSKQTRRNCDHVGVGIKTGKKYFIYRPSGSNVAKDTKYRKDFIRQLIETAGLPLNVIEREKGFMLSHHQESGLFISASEPGGLNPSSFRCELEGVSVGELESRVKTILNKYATEKRFEYWWSIATMGMENAEANRIYNVAVEKKIAAQKVEIGFSYILRQLEGIDFLRYLPGQKKEFSTRVCTFDLPGQVTAELHAITSVSGHFLEISITNPSGLPEVEAKLNLKLEKKC